MPRSKKSPVAKSARRDISSEIKSTVLISNSETGAQRGKWLCNSHRAISEKSVI